MTSEGYHARPSFKQKAESTLHRSKIVQAKQEHSQHFCSTVVPQVRMGGVIYLWTAAEQRQALPQAGVMSIAARTHDNEWQQIGVGGVQVRHDRLHVQRVVTACIYTKDALRS